MRFPAMLAAILLSMNAPAFAKRPDVVPQVGLFEVVDVPSLAYQGLYVFGGLTLSFDVKKVFINPTLSIEYAPDTGRWGFFGGITVDVPVRDGVGLDIGPIVVHDMVGNDWANAQYYLGLYLGATFTSGKWMVSPALVLYQGVNGAYTRGFAPLFQLGYAI